MKPSYRHLVFVVLLGALTLPTASADVRSLWDWAFIVSTNGGAPAVYNPAPLPSNFDTSNFDFSVADLSAFTNGNTLGSITATFGPGAYSVIAFLDYDIDGPNNGFNNESGSSGGTLAPGQSYGMGDPGALWNSGLITERMGTTDAFIHNTPEGQDEAMAIGYDFLVADTATLTWTVSGSAPNTGAFYLKQSDPGAPDPLVPSTDIFFSAEFGAPINDVPEPSSIVLLAIALGGAAAAARKTVRRTV